MTTARERAWQRFREWFDFADMLGIPQFKSLPAREIDTNELIRENAALRREVDRLRSRLVDCQGSKERLLRLVNRRDNGN